MKNVIRSPDTGREPIICPDLDIEAVSFGHPPYQKVSEPRFKIGTKFIPQGRKEKRICEVVDIYKTFNHKNVLVKVRYVSCHEFMGQKVYDYDVPDATIARGLDLNIKEEKRKHGF